MALSPVVTAGALEASFFGLAGARRTVRDAAVCFIAMTTTARSAFEGLEELGPTAAGDVEPRVKIIHLVHRQVDGETV